MLLRIANPEDMRKLYGLHADVFPAVDLACLGSTECRVRLYAVLPWYDRSFLCMQ